MHLLDPSNAQATFLPLKVLSLPHYAGSNPYQSQLNAALENEGVSFISWTRQVRLSHLRSLLAHRALPDLLHQQWIHVDTLRRTLARSLLATGLFLLQCGALRMAGVKIVWTLHNKANHDGTFPRLDRWIRRMMFHLAHAVIVHSEAAAKEVSECFAPGRRSRAKVRVVPHASYAGIYQVRIDREAARRSLGLRPEHFCYGLIGRLQAYKGVEELVRAFRKLPGAHLRLLLAGKVDSVPLEEWLTAQCVLDPRILLSQERLADAELQTCFRAVDAVVYAFRAQLTSGSVLLAASFGCALVLPDVPSLYRDLPQAGRILFQAGNPSALGDALRQVSEADVGTMGAANHAAMQAPEMSWKTMGKRTLAVYRSLFP